MRLLILGGTQFIGRHMVEVAIRAGYDVTLFNRGQTNPDLFPEVEKLKGDRDGGLDALKGRRWDVVIDNCGYVPRVVKQSAELLAEAVGRYIFISTISVYADPSRMGMDESAELAKIEDESIEEITGESYGALKVLCEQEVEEHLGGRATIIRPGLIVGPYDPTDRFTYWPWRVARGGEVLAPEPKDLRVQIIDGRDLAAWTLKVAAMDLGGTFNATGPDCELTMEAMLETCRQVSGNEAEMVWMGDDFLLARDVQPWSELPLWLPGRENTGMMRVSVEKAINAGLTFRPLVETVEDTLAWAAERPSDHEWRAGMKQERERELLGVWRDAQDT